MSDYLINPIFFAGNAGDIFTLNLEPKNELRGYVFYLPPFGEELNRCRTTISAHAKLFASAGIRCSVIDYFGTGDSDGDFCQGDLPLWLNDLSKLINSINAKNSLPVYLVGFRLGALIALQYLNENPNLITSTLLIQPVTNGKQYVTQLLRQKIAGQMGAGVPSTSTEDMRHSLELGHNIEIGGYELNSKLLMQLDKLTNDYLKDINNQNFDWLEFEQLSGKGLSISSQRVVSFLEQAGNIVETTCINDPLIWQLYERAKSPKSIEKISAVANKW